MLTDTHCHLMLTDTHCHLASSKFDNDREQVIARALESGVTRMVTIGTDLEDGPQCVALAERYPEIFATVGIHPCDVTETRPADWLDQISTLATNPRVAAIGEIGLDYFHPAPDGLSEDAYRERQRDVFQQQLALAAELGLNVVIHQRDRDTERSPCWRDILEIMAGFHGKLRAVFHCFIHDAHEAQKVLDHDHLISFTGVATYKKAPEVQATAAWAPPGSYMLETDAPYLTPVPYRGKRCEPAHTRNTAEHIAQLRQQTLEEIATETTATADHFFRFRIPSP